MPLSINEWMLIVAFGTALESKLRQVESEVRLGRDPRLFYYSGAVRSRNGKHSDASRSIRERYQACVFCGTKVNLTLAHLISEIVESEDVTLKPFGKPRYVDDLEVKSPRNFILLCGTKGEIGSCHDLFDNFRLGVNYDPFTLSYTLFAVDQTSPLHQKKIVFSEPFPYKRLLAWRFRKMILTFGSVLPDSLKMCDVVDHSDQGSIDGENVDEEENSSTSGPGEKGDASDV